MRFVVVSHCHTSDRERKKLLVFRFSLFGREPIFCWLAWVGLAVYCAMLVSRSDLLPGRLKSLTQIKMKKL